MVLTNLGLNAAGSQIQAIATAATLQSNGDIVVAGTFGLVRYLPDGTLDTAFGSGGTLTTTIQGNESVRALVIQPDGKIIAVGSSEHNSTGITDVFLARYLGA